MAQEPVRIVRARLNAEKHSLRDERRAAAKADRVFKRGVAQNLRAKNKAKRGEVKMLMEEVRNEGKKALDRLLMLDVPYDGGRMAYWILAPWIKLVTWELGVRKDVDYYLDHRGCVLRAPKRIMWTIRVRNTTSEELRQVLKWLRAVAP